MAGILFVLGFVPKLYCCVMLICDLVGGGVGGFDMVCGQGGYFLHSLRGDDLIFWSNGLFFTFVWYTLLLWYYD